jgi:hypothetical protein
MTLFATEVSPASAINDAVLIYFDNSVAHYFITAAGHRIHIYQVTNYRFHYFGDYSISGDVFKLIPFAATSLLILTTAFQMMIFDIKPEIAFTPLETDRLELD